MLPKTPCCFQVEAFQFPNILLTPCRTPCDHTLQEFANVGIDLASIIQERGIEFHYSEYGLGAGISVAGNKPARTAAEAAHTVGRLSCRVILIALRNVLLKYNVCIVAPAS